MAKKSEIERIQLQKRLLVAKSEIHRQTLGLEIQKIKDSTAWISKGIGIIKSSLPFLAVGAPVAGYFIARRKGRLQKFSHKVGWFWNALDHLKSFISGVRMTRRRRPASQEEEVFSEHFRPG